MMAIKYRILSIITFIVLILDQATKIYVDRVMDLHQSIKVIDNFFDITYLRNKGAAFSFLANFSYRLPFFILVTLVAVVVIIAMYRKLRPDQNLAAVSLALILGGAVGNLIDRVRIGEVIDFIYVHWYEHYWPAFNVADSAICVGVFLVAIELILEEKRQPHEKQSS